MHFVTARSLLFKCCRTRPGVTETYLAWKGQLQLQAGRAVRAVRVVQSCHHNSILTIPPSGHSEWARQIHHTRNRCNFSIANFTRVGAAVPSSFVAASAGQLLPGGQVRMLAVEGAARAATAGRPHYRNVSNTPTHAFRFESRSQYNPSYDRDDNRDGPNPICRYRGQSVAREKY